MYFSRLRLITLLTALIAVTFPLHSQVTSGNIAGTVYDPSQATIPNATIIARNVGTGVETTVTTTSAGDYRIPNLPVGEYSISVNAAGFNKGEVNHVEIRLNETVTTNVTLTVGTAATSVQVTESAMAIDTTTAQVQTTFQSKQIADLPSTSTGSGVINLSLLSAGVALSSNVGVGTGPSIGGQRPRNNNFTIEGIDNNNGSVTGPLVKVPNDAVQEFTLLTNQYSPDFGHSSGGQFNQVVKSGTNEFHGELYEYFQNRNLNAADNFSAVTGTPLHPRYDDNRFGGNFGGPILRNKLFFFADYEYNPTGQAGSAGLLFAPTQAGYNTLASIPGISQTNLNIFKQYLGAAPAASAAAPKVTVGGTAIEIGQVSIAAPSYQNNEAGVGAIDYTISDRDSLRGRFVLNRTGFIDTAASLPAFFTTVPYNYYLATVSEYHSFSPNMINELRLGYNRYSNNYGVGPQKFPGLDRFPNLEILQLNVQIGPDPSAPQFASQNTYQLNDNLSWTRASHNLKFGFDGIRLINPQSFTQRSRGDYQWTTLNGYLFDSTPDYLAQRSQGNPIYWGNRYLLGWYGNDSWQLRPNVTLNLGLRYEYQTVPAGEQLQNLNALASVPGLIQFNVPSAQTNALMPRIGIAYSPGTSGKTSIRAGFGINYDVLYDNQGLLTLPPQLSTTVDVTGAGGTNFLASGGIPPTGPSASLTPAQARAATAGFVPNQQRPESIQWNFGIQHEFGGNYVFETRYLGDRGVYLPLQDQLNRQPVVNASNALPVYFSMPSQATLDSLTSTLGALTAAYSAHANVVPAFLAAGFISPITAYMPRGNSVYHGWANELTRRFANGLQLKSAYTWSHNIDDSTADVASTYLTPRRAQDSQNLRADRASSALDHRNRITLEAIYDLPFFKQRSWFLKNIVGNWEFAPIYTYQTGTLYTVQSGTDSNLNGDSAPDRAIINPNGGNPNISSGTTPLANSAGQTVAYLVTNPSALYVATPKGALATAGRNTAHLNPIDDIDITALKRFNVTERYRLEFSGQIFNILNHPQYVAGYLNNVATVPSGTFANPTVLSFVTAGSKIFNNPSQAFSSNPRGMVLTLKFLF